MSYVATVGRSIMMDINEAQERNKRRINSCELPHDFKLLPHSFSKKHKCNKCGGEVVEKELYKYI